MKVHVLVSTIALVLCGSFTPSTITSPKGFNYYKTFSISHQSAELELNHIEHRIMMSKNTVYNIVIKDNDCDVLMQLHDEKGRLIVTNSDINNDVDLHSIIFKCNSTKYYNLSLDPKRSRAHGVCMIGFEI